MVDPVTVAKWVGGTAFAGGVILLIYIAISYMVGIIIKYQSSRSDAGSMWYKFPKWLFPNKKIHDWVGYPATFSMAVDQTVVAATFITQLSNTTPADCMLECAGDKECTGFMYQKTATGNNCTLVSFMDGLTPSTSNTVYVIDGRNDIIKYDTYDLKVPPIPADIPITTIVVPTLSNLATVTTTTVHPFTTGQTVKIDGNLTVNGSNVITVLDSSRFTFPYKTTTDITSAGGKATLVVSTLPRWSHTKEMDAKANCVSQADCTGFTFDPIGGANNYTPYTVDLDPTKFVASTSNTYVLSASAFTKSTTEYY